MAMEPDFRLNMRQLNGATACYLPGKSRGSGGTACHSSERSVKYEDLHHECCRESFRTTYRDLFSSRELKDAKHRDRDWGKDTQARLQARAHLQKQTVMQGPGTNTLCL